MSPNFNIDFESYTPAEHDETRAWLDSEKAHAGSWEEGKMLFSWKNDYYRSLLELLSKEELVVKFKDLIERKGFHAYPPKFHETLMKSSIYDWFTGIPADMGWIEVKVTDAEIHLKLKDKEEVGKLMDLVREKHPDWLNL